MKSKFIIALLILLYASILLMVILNLKAQNEIHNCAIHKFNTENLTTKLNFDHYIQKCKEQLEK